MKLPLVSIVVPVYNSGQYLRECLDSLLRQTHQDIEIVVVDDGSTDDSPLICDAYARKDSRIAVIHQKNSGALSARRVGVAAATGDFVYFMDADDTISFDTIESGMALVLDDVDLVAMEEDESAVLSPQEYGQRLLYWNGVHIWGKLFRKRVLDLQWAFDIPKEITVAEDFLINLRALKGLRGNVIVSALKKYHYRQVPGSVIHSFKITPEYDVMVMNEALKAISGTQLDLHQGSVVYQIGILKHLICWRYPFDREWAYKLKSESLEIQLDFMQRLVVSSIDRPGKMLLVRVINPFKKVVGRIKRLIRFI